ncbi:hypothetical protein A6574_25425, partial [Escherichia coli]
MLPNKSNLLPFLSCSLITKTTFLSMVPQLGRVAKTFSIKPVIKPPLDLLKSPCILATAQEIKGGPMGNEKS